MKPLFEAINNIFVDDVDEILNEQRDISKHPYFKGLSDSTIRKRKKWIDEKKEKYANNDYSVYKEKGPGDSKKTKPSKHTKKVRKKIKNDLSLEAKAKHFKVPLNILKEVYRRGVGAWTSGSRPGVTASQWGHGRVNSFLSKGKTYETTDADLAKEWRKYKKLQKEKKND
jgi:reverse gyrase